MCDTDSDDLFPNARQGHLRWTRKVPSLSQFLQPFLIFYSFIILPTIVAAIINNTINLLLHNNAMLIQLTTAAWTPVVHESASSSQPGTRLRKSVRFSSHVHRTPPKLSVRWTSPRGMKDRGTNFPPHVWRNLKKRKPQFTTDMI